MTRSAASVTASRALRAITAAPRSGMPGIAAKENAVLGDAAGSTEKFILDVQSEAASVGINQMSPKIVNGATCSLGSTPRQRAVETDFSEAVAAALRAARSALRY